jgi:hypothetical protein
MSKRTLYEVTAGVLICVGILFYVNRHYSAPGVVDSARETQRILIKHEIAAAEQDVAEATTVLKGELAKPATLIAQLGPEGITAQMELLQDAQSNVSRKTIRLEQLKAAATDLDKP